ncbi:ABC transporter substrate-binding protein [Desulfovibrio inopinatus]|uniref:ABC transporter substrate-binding protein n=1 Tax=Desulfovibrio inopinatus TaxID=102109 RepID=UPI000420DC64|nr:ABC transporter substrate-binding protein [Desulfovibrio inopinatus]
MRTLFGLCVMICAIMVSSMVSAADDPIKIGAVLSVTGPASFLGEPEKNTILMLEEQINAAGGVLGRPVDIIVYDDETNVNKAVLSADKLLKKDRVVAVLGPSVSGNTLAIMNKFETAKVPLISCSAAEKIVKPVKPYVFKTPQSDRLAVGKILDFAKVKGQKKIAIITVSNGYGQAGREVLKEMIPASGMELVADEVYGPKDTDMTAQLTKIKNIAPDAIICWGTNPGPAVIARNRVQLGITTPLYMSHGVASNKFIELAGEAANGLILPASQLIVADQLADDDPQKALLLSYIKAYSDAFGTPPSAFGGYGHDALMLVVEAIKSAGSAEPHAVRDGLEATKDFRGITGVFTMSPEDHNGLDSSAFVMVAIENGAWKIIGE